MTTPNVTTGRLLTELSEASLQFARLEALFCAIRDGFLDADTYEWQLADIGLHTAARSVVALNRLEREFSAEYSSKGTGGV
ncbi:hypothetical protein WL78_00460 [Burkholderia ubonensis]|uniref:hypothetical protein n=1 Tax=Burkholderia ubonensis TaxID=101571 RepID=UPI0007720EC7|nr:hypothetical protein [Burkholderia ubonensis]KWE77268.1 hypothetical protein WL78_00460 [Burkholderia ubonensis]